MGETGVYSTLSGMHALVLCDLERWDDAAEAVAASERTTSPDDRASHILIGAAQGRLLAARGSVEEAEAHARKAIAIAETTDFLTMHGDALVALGRVLEAARRAARGAGGLRAGRRALRAQGQRRLGRPSTRAHDRAALTAVSASSAASTSASVL